MEAVGTPYPLCKLWGTWVIRFGKDCKKDCGVVVE